MPPTTHSLSRKGKLALDFSHDFVYNAKDRHRRQKFFLPTFTRTRVWERETQMGTYPIETIIHEWAKGKLTNEQAMGQVLQLIQELQDRLKEIEIRLFRWEQQNRA